MTGFIKLNTSQQHSKTRKGIELAKTDLYFVSHEPKRRTTVKREQQQQIGGLYEH